MTTDFKAMDHQDIYDAVHVGAPGVVSGAASQLDDLNKVVTTHLDALDKLAASMADAWPDENGQNFRSTLGHTISYLRELQATHIVAASSSVTQVMSASHEKLSTTLSTMPPPPAVPVADQQKTLNKQLTQHDGAMTAGLAAEGQHIAAGKADDAKAVVLATSLANTYLAEKAKLTAPPAAPKGSAGTGSGRSVAVGNGSGTSSSHAMAGYQGSAGNGGSAASLVSSETSGGGNGSHAGDSVTFAPIHNGGDAGGYGAGSGHGASSGYGVNGVDGQLGAHAHNGSLLDPNSLGGPLYDAHGNLIGGTGFDGSGSYGAGGSGGASVNGVLGGGQGSGSGFDASTLGLTAVGGGLAAAGIIAARKQAAQRAEQAALLKQQLLEEESAAGGANGNLTASQLAAINAQRNGILSAGQQAGLMNGDRTMLAQQRNLLGANAAMTAEEEAQRAAGQRLVPGQLGGTTAAGTTGSPRGGMPFSGGGVVGGAERVTWLVEDRDLFSADPGVRAVIDD